MKKLLVATTNKGKLAEIKYLLRDLPLTLIGLDDLEIKDKIEESGKSYRDNAQIKSLYYARKSGLPTLADDGGLEIDILGGEPGMKTRRWVGGQETSDEALISYTLQRLKPYPEEKRKACLVAVLALAFPDGEIFFSQGKICGIISDKPFRIFTKGYPFRSLLFLPEIKKFYHQDDLTPEENRKYNHRGRALIKLRRIIQEKVLK